MCQLFLLLGWLSLLGYVLRRWHIMWYNGWRWKELRELIPNSGGCRISFTLERHKVHWRQRVNAQIPIFYVENIMRQVIWPIRNPPQFSFWRNELINTLIWFFLQNQKGVFFSGRLDWVSRVSICVTCEAPFQSTFLSNPISNSMDSIQQSFLLNSTRYSSPRATPYLQLL